MSVGVPYEMKPLSGLTAISGQPNCFEIDFPSRALINKIVVAQLDGAMDGFTVAIYNAMRPCLGVAESDSDGDETGNLPDDLYRVTPDLSTSSDRLVYFSEESTGGTGFTFFNQDKGTSAARLGNARKLYLQITPAGTGPKTFAVALGGMASD
jgi:hypothetical protein